MKGFKISPVLKLFFKVLVWLFGDYIYKAVTQSIQTWPLICAAVFGHFVKN